MTRLSTAAILCMAVPMGILCLNIYDLVMVVLVALGFFPGVAPGGTSMKARSRAKFDAASAG